MHTAVGALRECSVIGGKFGADFTCASGQADSALLADINGEKTARSLLNSTVTHRRDGVLYTLYAGMAEL